MDPLRPAWSTSTLSASSWLIQICPIAPTDDLIAEFGLETMRDFLARVRRDRRLVLDGHYVPDLEKNPPLPGTPL